ncbi:hypothetical protein MC885_015981 [Smutsia gigantea]|nr:hypothetical protein MC885_015981 [Smutsia gigantea]
MGEKKEGRGGGGAAAADGGAGAAASRALQQCGQLQKLIDISIGSLRGLRTKCAVSNDLTQQEIRTLEAPLTSQARALRDHAHNIGFLAFEEGDGQRTGLCNHTRLLPESWEPQPTLALLKSAVSGRVST